MQYVGWLFLYLVLLVLGEFLAEFTRIVDSDQDLKPVAVVWYVLLGLLFGFLTITAFPDRLLSPEPFRGVSMLILPIVLGAGLALVGFLRGATRSHFASWYGGAAMGVGLAAGRLIGLAIVGEVRSI